jgi:hypothetical protein
MRVRRAGALAVVAALALGARPSRADGDFEACRAAALAAQHAHAAQKLLEEREQLLRCMRPECPEVIQTSCRRWLDANDQARPSIVVVAKEADGSDVLDAAFTVDDGATARTADGTPLELDPGAHVIHVSAPGHAPVSLEIVVAEGVKLRNVALSWPARPAPEPKELANSRPAAPLERPIPTRVVVLGSAAAAALVTSAVFGALAWREYNDLRASNSPDQQPLPTYRVVGDVALGVGIVLAGITLWQYLTRPSVPRQAAQLGQSSL